MIVDRLDCWNQYPFGETWKRVFDFLLTLEPNAEEKRYLIKGDDVYAQVASYETRFQDTAVLEAHRKYIDIQALLMGQETIGWIPQEGLEVKELYNPTKDVEFYHHPKQIQAQLHLQPGVFTLFKPHDAHMPGLVLGDTPTQVKKVVVKIKVDLLECSCE